jgi:hypothetical protein
LGRRYRHRDALSSSGWPINCAPTSVRSFRPP